MPHDTIPKTAERLPWSDAVRAGLRDSAAAGLGILPFGVAFGLLVIQVGLPWWFAPALSTAMFSGSVELLLVGLAAAGAPLVAIAGTVLVVNFRHVFYAFSFPIDLARGRWARLYAVYAMIDEVYAVQAALPASQRSAARLISMQVACQAYWVGGGLLGVCLGAVLPGPVDGLEFALCALFVVLTLESARSQRDTPSLVLAGLAASFALSVTPSYVPFTAVSVFVAALFIRRLLRRRGHATRAGGQRG